jgi:hypothetical protein
MVTIASEWRIVPRMDDDEVQLQPIRLTGHESRQLAKAILALTGLLLALAALLVIVAPVGPTPMSAVRGSAAAVGLAVSLAGFAGLAFGLAWMIRIYRQSIDVEPDHGNWRYRSR